MGRLLAELRRRNVFRVGVAYVVVGWVLIEAADVLLGNFDAPDWVFQTFAVLVFLGFPLALVFAWAFDLTPDGLKRADQVPVESSISARTGRRLDFVIIALLGIALAYFMTTHEWVRDADRSPDTGRELSSIAVLPFVNMSGNPDNEYFSDGLSEELISLLTSATDLHVAGRSSSFAFKDENLDLRTIGEKLGVESILEGSVRRSGAKVRITAQLTSTDDGYQLWSQNYDRTLDDLFAVQQDIAGNIVTALHGALGDRPEGLPLETVALTRDTEAYQLYLRGRYHFHKRGETNLRESIALFKQATARDPDFAEAHAAMAAAVFVLPGYSLDTYAGLIDVAGRHARRALALDASLSEAQVVLGAVTGMQLDWITARGYYERALSGASGNSLVHHWFGVHLLATAQLEDGTSQLTEAHRLDPLSAVIAAWLGATYSISGDWEPAARYRRIAIADGYALGHFRLFEIALATGDPDQAASSLTAYLESFEIGTAADASRIVAGLGDTGQREAAITTVASLRERFTIPWHVIELFALLGAMDQALHAAEQAVDSNDLIATWGIWTPMMSELRRHPRFPALLERMRLIEYWNQFGWPSFCRPTPEGALCE